MVEVNTLNPGALVRAIRPLVAASGPLLPKGMLGVVYDVTGVAAYNPTVRWFNGASCAVFDGDVEEVRSLSGAPGQLIFVDLDLNGHKPYELTEKSGYTEEGTGYEALKAFFEDIDYVVRDAVVSERRFS